VRTFFGQGGKGSIFCEFVQISFMVGPLQECNINCIPLKLGDQGIKSKSAGYYAANIIANILEPNFVLFWKIKASHSPEN